MTRGPHPNRRTHKLCHAHLQAPDARDPETVNELQLNAWLGRRPDRIERTDGDPERLGWVIYNVDIPLHVLPESQMKLLAGGGVLTQICGFPDAGNETVLWSGKRRLPADPGDALRIELKMALI